MKRKLTPATASPLKAPAQPPVLLADLRDLILSARQALPECLAHEVDPKDFELKLKPQEEKLAQELVDCFETLNRQTNAFNFSALDILDEVFGKFPADSFIDEKELGQYLTPPEVVRFMIGLAMNALAGEDLETLCNPKRCGEAGLILDPSCGVASFLVEMVQSLRETVESKVEDTKSRALWLKNMLENVVVGIDKSERMVRLALTNVAMFGFPMTKLHLANSLARNGTDGKLTDSLVGKVKLILSNPPFGACYQGNDLVRYKIATALERWDAQHHASLSAEIEQRLNRKNESDLRVADVAELIDERADPRRRGTKEFNYIEICISLLL